MFPPCSIGGAKCMKEPCTAADWRNSSPDLGAWMLFWSGGEEKASLGRLFSTYCWQWLEDHVHPGGVWCMDKTLDGASEHLGVSGLGKHRVSRPLYGAASPPVT